MAELEFKSRLRTCPRLAFEHTVLALRRIVLAAELGEDEYY